LKAKLLKSSILGALIPWSYFLIVTVSPLRVYDQAGNDVTPREAPSNGGVLGFIEFYGVEESLLMYLGASMFCGLIVFVISSINEFISNK
jgi:hypothetical protein